MTKKSKGVKRKIVKEELSYQDYKDIVLKPKKRIFRDFNNIESIKHQVTTTKKRKPALSAFDDKRFILDDGVNTRSHGHFRNFSQYLCYTVDVFDDMMLLLRYDVSLSNSINRGRQIKNINNYEL